MFKKMLVSLMAMLILTLQASAASTEGLKTAFDELNYSLNVEWDQKDLSFKLTQVEKFNRTLYALKAQGLSDAEIIGFLKTEIQDAKLARDLEAAFTMIALTKMSPTEANSYVLDVVKNTYSQGTSWRGRTYLYIGAGILIVALAIIIAKSVRKHNLCDDFKDNNSFVCDYYYPGGIQYDNCYWTDSHCK